jgi:hypothetical protein
MVCRHEGRSVERLISQIRGEILTLRDTLLVLHIVAAAAWLGGNLVQMTVPALARGEGGPFLAGWTRVVARMGGRFYMPAGVVLLGTGVWMVLIGPYRFEDAFVVIGISVVVIGAVLGVVVFTPKSFQAAEAHEAGDKARVRAVVNQIAGFGALDTVLVLFTITVMVLRLGA